MNGHEKLMWRMHGRHIHVMLGEEPDAHDPFIGTMDTPELAQRVVEDHNRHIPEPDFPFGPQPKPNTPTRRVIAKEVWCPLVRRWMTPEEHSEKVTDTHLDAGHRYQY